MTPTARIPFGISDRPRRSCEPHRRQSSVVDFSSIQFSKNRRFQKRDFQFYGPYWRLSSTKSIRRRSSRRQPIRPPCQHRCRCCLTGMRAPAAFTANSSMPPTIVLPTLDVSGTCDGTTPGSSCQFTLRGQLHRAGATLVSSGFCAPFIGLPIQGRESLRPCHRVVNIQFAATFATRAACLAGARDSRSHPLVNPVDCQTQQPLASPGRRSVGNPVKHVNPLSHLS